MSDDQESNDQPIMNPEITITLSACDVCHQPFRAGDELVVWANNQQTRTIHRICQERRE